MPNHITTKQVKPQTTNGFLPNNTDGGILSMGFMQLLLTYGEPFDFFGRPFITYQKLSNAVCGVEDKEMNDIINFYLQLCRESIINSHPQIRQVLSIEPEKKNEIDDIINAQIYKTEQEKASIALSNTDRNIAPEFLAIIKDDYNKFLSIFITDPYERERKENIRRQQELDNPPTESYDQDSYEEQQGKFKIIDYNKLMEIYYFLGKELGSNFSDIDFIQSIKNADLSGFKCKNKSAVLVHVIYQMGYIDKASDWAYEAAKSLRYSKSFCKQKFDFAYSSRNGWLNKMIREIGIETKKLCA